MKTVENNILYQIDEKTNARIAIVTTDTLNDCVIEQNQLFKLDKETNARIPVVYLLTTVDINSPIDTYTKTQINELLEQKVSLTGNQKVSGTKIFDNGVGIASNATLQEATMGLDAPFGTDALRFFNSNTGGNIQFVSHHAGIQNWAGGKNVMNMDSSGMNMLGNKIIYVADPSNDTDAVNKKYVDELIKMLSERITALGG